MSRELEIWCKAQKLGLLTAQEGIWSLQYDPAWIEYEDHFALSPHLPLATNTIIDASASDIGAGQVPASWFHHGFPALRGRLG